MGKVPYNSTKGGDSNYLRVYGAELNSIYLGG